MDSQNLFCIAGGSINRNTRFGKHSRVILRSRTLYSLQRGWGCQATLRRTPKENLGAHAPHCSPGHGSESRKHPKCPMTEKWINHSINYVIIYGWNAVESQNKILHSGDRSVDEFQWCNTEWKSKSQELDQPEMISLHKVQSQAKWTMYHLSIHVDKEGMKQENDKQWWE